MVYNQSSYNWILYLWNLYKKCNQIKELIYIKHPEQLKKRDKHQQEYDEMNTEDPKVMESPRPKKILLNEQKIENIMKLLR